MCFETEGLSDEGYSGTSDILANARNGSRVDMWDGFNRSGANRKVWLHEEYARFDLNGDGIAELLMVHRVGNTILMRDGQYAIEEKIGRASGREGGCQYV